MWRLGNARILFVLLAGFVGATILIQNYYALSSSPRSQDVKVLQDVRQRQMKMEKELFQLGVHLAKINETWRSLALEALNQPKLRRSERDGAPLGHRPPPETNGAPWGHGPPPDSYFAVKKCAPLRLEGLDEDVFHVYRHNTSACERAQLSWKLEPQCASGKLRRQVLISGVQRSGTHFTWELLNRLGVHVHHEGLGPAGSVSWLFTWRAARFVINNPTHLTNDYRFCVLLHQVRHPLRVISSVVKATKPRDIYWQWIYGVEPSIDPKSPPPIRAAHLWVLQNRRLERIADARFRVEETSPRDICRAAGFDEILCAGDGSYHTTSSRVVQPIIEPKRRSQGDPNEASSAPYHPPAVSWDQLDQIDVLISSQAKEMALSYGYNLDPRFHPQSLATTEFKAR